MPDLLIHWPGIGILSPWKHIDLHVYVTQRRVRLLSNSKSLILGNLTMGLALGSTGLTFEEFVGVPTQLIYVGIELIFILQHQVH